VANDFGWWNGQPLDAAWLTEVVDYFLAGFLLLQAYEPEHVSVQRS
jgi:hypothetical protein